MKFRYFTFCATRNDLRKQYLILVKKYHPDNYQSIQNKEVAAAVFQKVMAEYDKLLEILGKKEEKQQAGSSSKKDKKARASYSGGITRPGFPEEDFKYLISLLQTRPYITGLELVGFYIWFSSDYKYKSDLCSLNFRSYQLRYARKKKRFYISLFPDYKPYTHREYSMEEIRNAYRSLEFDQAEQKELQNRMG